MKIVVFGLWHLGLVTAACLANKGYEFNVVGLDTDEKVIYNLENHYNMNTRTLPISEPNLKETIERGISDGNLKFTTDISSVEDANIIWVTFDTPVDDNDNANIEYVKQQIISIFPYLSSGMTVLISSQLPVGSTSELEEIFKIKYPEKDVNFAYSPENLRHGKAIEIFNNPGRIIVGTKDENNIPLKLLIRTICTNVIYMSSESAEMTKHALNSFLATEISFINEISLICKKTGANIKDIERGLKSDSRVGEKAFLRAGEPYSGGTLARDVEYLHKISDELNLKSTLIRSINESNNNHKKLLEK